MKKVSVNCSAERGLFSSESFITLNTGYETVQSFVSTDLISDGKIELNIHEETDEDYLVAIPGDIFKGQTLMRFKKPTLLKNRRIVKKSKISNNYRD